MKHITEKEVAKQITELINKNINQLKSDDEKWKNQYESVMSDLEMEIKNTEEIIEDFKESKLSINVIEQEGYLRCLKTMINRFRDYKTLDLKFNDMKTIKKNELLPSYYTEVGEPSYQGKGNHNILELEEIAENYKELVHQLRLREQAILNKFSINIINKA